MSDLVGQIVAGSYRVVSKIGEGGMGEVWAAVHVDTARMVALKRLHPHLAEKEDITARFRREAHAATSIGHPNIVEVIDTGAFDDGSLFMILELLEGRDLAAEIADRGALRVGRLSRLAIQICDALHAAHEKGIIHRDLKPENVYLVERDGDPSFVKVLDFGISKFLDLDGAMSQMTRTGTTVGTPWYMAPEQAQARKDIDRRADVYSLGVILFRALTGQHPFDDESYPMLVLKICTEAPPPVRRYRPDVPAELEQVVLRMLAKQPDDRYPDCLAVRAALSPFRSVDDAPVLTDAPGTRTTRASALDHERVDSPLAHAATEQMTDVSPKGDWASGPGLPAATAPAGEKRSEREADEDGDDDDDVEAVVGTKGESNLVRWVLLIAAVATVGLAGALALTMESDTPIEDQDPDLPDPQPPETRALVSPGHGGIGWTWVNPQPRAMPTWYDVDVAGPGLVAMVGFAGQAARFSDGGMYLWDTGAEVALRGVSWTGAREALAVGDEGTIRVLKRDDPTQVIEAGTDATLRDVVAVSATEQWIVGDGGTLLRIAAYRASPVRSGTESDLLAAHVWDDAIYVAGAAGTVLRVEGEQVTAEESGTSATLRAIGSCPRGTLYAAGDEGKLLRRLEDGRWQRIEHDLRENLSDIGCDHANDRVVVSGLRGGSLLVAGGRAVVLESGTDASLHGVGGARDAPTWIVGDGGRLLQVENDHLRTLTAGPTVPLWDMNSIAGALVAVGEWGRIVRQHEQGFRETPTPTKSALAGLARHGNDKLLAVGDNGALVEIAHDEARLIDSPSDTHWRDVVSDGAAFLAVGVGGRMLRGSPGSWEQTRVADAGDLWSVSGSPAGAVAVGDAGLVLRVSGGRSSRVPCEVDVSLRGVWASGERVWAVGERGTIVRVEQGRCEVERRGGDERSPTLNDVGAGPNGGPLAVGNRGTALERGEDGQWTQANLDVGRANLRGVIRTSRNVYIVGAGGVIVRHIRLDGG